MKRTLPAGTAYAQSSVQIYGLVDAMLAHGRRSGPAASRFTALASGGMRSSRIGFRRLEDLGGGLSAGYNLEAQVYVDSGLGQPANINSQSNSTGASASCTVTGLDLGIRHAF